MNDLTIDQLPIYSFWMLYNNSSLISIRFVVLLLPLTKFLFRRNYFARFHHFYANLMISLGYECEVSSKIPARKWFFRSLWNI